jgi:hypothetical protein
MNSRLTSQEPWAASSSLLDRVESFGCALICQQSLRKTSNTARADAHVLQRTAPSRVFVE